MGIISMLGKEVMSCCCEKKCCADWHASGEFYDCPKCSAEESKARESDEDLVIAILKAERTNHVLWVDLPSKGVIEACLFHDYTWKGDTTHVHIKRMGEYVSKMPWNEGDRL